MSVGGNSMGSVPEGVVSTSSTTDRRRSTTDRVGSVPEGVVSTSSTTDRVGSTTDRLRSTTDRLRSTTDRVGSTGEPRVVLVGPPGAGKSAVGQELASRWGVPMCDTDAVVEARAGKPVAEIFFDEGEPAFRALEQAAVADALQSCPGVVSLGGGAVTAEATRQLLAAAPVAFLDVGLSAAASRVGLAANRPLLLGNVRGQLKALLDARRPLYEQVASIRVATDALSVQEVADEVERLLGLNASRTCTPVNPRAVRG